MDANLTIPWSKRIQYLRWAIRYTKSGFSMLLGIGQGAVNGIIRGNRPTLYQVRRIRLLERIFADDIENFKREVRKWRAVKHAKLERDEIVYDAYNGTLTRTVTHYHGRAIIPTRPEDIKALGGMEAVSRAASVQEKKYEVTEARRSSLRRVRRIVERKHRTRTNSTLARRMREEADRVERELVENNQE